MDKSYDLVLSGGHVIDPRNLIDGPNDVAVKDKRIAAVGPDLAGAAEQVIDVTGLYVTPGLLDIHMHAYGGFNAWLFPDPHSLNCGVTTVVDTGSAGYRDFEDFKRTIIDGSTTRVLAFLNIVGDGMTGPPEQDVTDMNVGLCAEAIMQYSDDIVGAKSAHFGGARLGIGRRRHRSGAAQQYDHHVGFLAPSRAHLRRTARALQPGRYPHPPLLDADPLVDRDSRKVQEYVWEARKRGSSLTLATAI